ncbi:MAG: hypothetical protein JSV43_03105 [Methanobacteriota archaeon]|nr:MAG: hypothetical protein JSV43_03105 [Euryarchaeota archaeon]
MKKQFSFEGSVYSENKTSFKKILKKHGFAWKGKLGDFIWLGKNEKMIAEFERDPERDITLSATLVWSGKKKTDFLKELEEWAKDVGGEKSVAKEKTPLSDKRIQEELKFWDKLNKPDEERLKSEGRPEDWIKKDLKKWRKRRNQKRKELIERYG